MFSLVNKLANFQSLVYSSAYSIFCVTETWLSDSIFGYEILTENYTLYRNDRNSSGGGVLVAVNDSIPSSLVYSPSNLKIVCVQIELTSPFHLCTVYVPPNSDLSYLESVIDFFCCEVALQKQMSSAKALYETVLIKSFSQNDPSKIYKYIDKVTGHNSIPISVSYKSDLEKASLFNKYFNSIFTRSTYTLPGLMSPKCTCKDIAINEEEVFRVLSTLDPTKAAGCDNIGRRLLRHCALVL